MGSQQPHFKEREGYTDLTITTIEPAYTYYSYHYMGKLNMDTYISHLGGPIHSTPIKTGRIYTCSLSVDGELHIELLAKSSLDWTVVRSPVMKATGSADYTLQHTSISPLATIPRIAVATAMVALLQSQDYSRTAPYISRR